MNGLTELPGHVGVYRFTGVTKDGYEHHTKAQLDIDGRWWPYPYHLSEWRPGELMTYDSVEQLGLLLPDAPNHSEVSKAETRLQEAADELEAAILAVNVAYRKISKRQKKLNKVRRQFAS